MFETVNLNARYCGWRQPRRGAGLLFGMRREFCAASMAIYRVARLLLHNNYRQALNEPYFGSSFF